MKNPKIPKKRTRKYVEPDRPNSHQRGYTRQWSNARKKFLIEHPHCVMCLAQGKEISAKVVDHIIPHKGDMVLFWDRGNWQSLCASHHSRDKQKQEKTQQTRTNLHLVTSS